MPQGNLSKRLYEPSSVVMISGGIDSVAVLKRLLEETDEKIYAHHVHIKNNEGMHNIKRYKAEALALRKIVPYMKKNFRDFHYSESTIDVRQMDYLRDGSSDIEDEKIINRIFSTYDTVYYHSIGGQLANITNSSFMYTGDMQYSPASPINNYRNPLIFKETFKHLDLIFNGSAYPHKAELKRPFWDKYCKTESVKYLGKELMSMVFYCRNPIKKNGKILSCNTDLGFDHKALDEETGQVFKCRPCKNVTDTFLELREEQQRIH